MSDRAAHLNSLPDDLHSAANALAVDALIRRLRAYYPDMSRFTAVSMTGRGRDFLHHLVHTRIGGLLPRRLFFNDYRSHRTPKRQAARPCRRMFLPPLSCPSLP